MIDIFNQFREFKSFEAALIHEGDNPQKIFCSINSVENDKITIDASNKKNHAVAVVGDELKLYIYTENGVYTAKSKVLEVDKGLLLTKYVIAHPEDTKHSQRRDYFRADMTVKFNIEATPKDETQKIFLERAETKNICGKGLCYISKHPFPVCKEIKIDLWLDNETIETESILIHSSETTIAGKIKYIHAFNFTTISQRNIDYIVKKCFLHQLELRKQQKDRLV